MAAVVTYMGLSVVLFQRVTKLLSITDKKQDEKVLLFLFV